MPGFAVHVEIPIMPLHFCRNRSTLALFLMAGLASSALAQTVENGVVPDGLAANDGNSSTNSPLATDPRTYQTILDAGVLEEIPAGAVITSIAFRLDASSVSAWPPAGATFSDYEIRIGKAALTAINASATFANNVVAGTDVLVRNGVLGPLANTFSAAETAPDAEAWGPTINFTDGFYYTGGGLTVTIRHSGQFGGVTPLVDGRLGGGIRGVVANGQLAASGAVQSTGLVFRIGFVRDGARVRSGVAKVFAGEEFATADGDLGTLVSLFDTVPRTIGTIIAPGELDSFSRGTRLTGVSIRNDQSTTVPPNSAWPQEDRAIALWWMQLSRSELDVGQMSETISENVGADAVTVYNSPLAIPANSLLPDPTPGTFAVGSPYSFVVPFSSPYEYRGGPMFMLTRSSGHGESGDLRADANVAFAGIQERSAPNAASLTLPVSSHGMVYRFNADAGVIAPNSRVASDGTGGTTWMMLDDEQTYQMVIGASELKHIPPGSLIDSLSFRRMAVIGTPWPSQDASALDFDVWLSTAARTPLTMSSTFATNEGPDKIQVRNGALGIPKNSYPAPATGASAFGPALQFQRAFVYNGGDLAITVRQSGVKASGSALFFGVSNDLEFETVVRAVSNNNDRDAVSGSFTLTPVVRLGYTACAAVPGPEADGRHLFNGTRTNQIIYSANALSQIPPGAKITGMSVRGRTTDADDFYPAVDTVLNRFDVSLSTAARTPATMSNIVANNEGPDLRHVRSGPLTMPAGALRESSITPSNDEDGFDFFIDFPQAFFYRGGPLAVTMRTDSSLPGKNIAAAATSADAAMKRDSANADSISVNTDVPPFIIRFAYTPPSSCPADLNKDGVVNDEDFTLFVGPYNTLDCSDGEMPGGCPADLNYDGFVDDADFQVFVVAYEQLVCS